MLPANLGGAGQEQGCDSERTASLPKAMQRSPGKQEQGQPWGGELIGSV